MKIFNLFKRKPLVWHINDECYIWQEVQIGDDEYEVSAVYGVVTKLFKNGKISVYLFKSRRTIHVLKSELHK